MNIHHSVLHIAQHPPDCGVATADLLHHHLVTHACMHIFSAYSFSCGSTWHAAGLMAIPLTGNTLITKCRFDTIKLIPELEKDSGCETGTCVSVD